MDQSTSIHDLLPPPSAEPTCTQLPQMGSTLTNQQRAGEIKQQIAAEVDLSSLPTVVETFIPSRVVLNTLGLDDITLKILLIAVVATTIAQ